MSRKSKKQSNKPEKRYVVYLLANKYDEKYYVGQTSQPLHHRMDGGSGYKQCTYIYNSIRKYGLKYFCYTVLKSNLTKDEADYWEKFYIRLFSTQDNRFGYNIKSGGQEGKGMSDEGRNSLKDKYTNKPCFRSRPVSAFNLDGSLYMRFDFIAQAARHFGLTDSSYIHYAIKRNTLVKNHYLRFTDEINYADHIEVGLTPKERHIESHKKKIDQYDTTGHYIKTFNSINEAAKEVGNTGSSISCVLAHRYGKHTAGGFLWKYHDGSTEDITPPPPKGECHKGKRHHAARAVVQLDKLTGEYIREFDTIMEAADSIPITHTAVGKACKGENPSAGGYKWKYKTDYEKEKEGL
jgi:hypothetical protein